MSEVRKPKTGKATKPKPAPDAGKRKPKLVKSASGKTARGKAKEKDFADIKGDAPVLPDKDPRPEHVVRGLELGLTLKEIEFVEVYLTCYNGVRTYMEVYGTTNYNMAGVESMRVLRRPKVKQYIGERMKEAFERTEAAQDQIIQTYTMIAYGDVNELVEYRREACRYCHGDGHRYQYTPAEMDRARKQHKKDQAKALAATPPVKMADFDEQGGTGFNPHREPHPECPECFGEGIGNIHFHDTRNLSPAALAMYEGAEVGKEGTKIKITSRSDARDKLAKILKVYEENKTEVTLNLSVDSLEATYGERMRKAQEKMLAMRAERGIKEGG